MSYLNKFNNEHYTSQQVQANLSFNTWKRVSYNFIVIWPNLNFKRLPDIATYGMKVFVWSNLIQYDNIWHRNIFISYRSWTNNNILDACRNVWIASTFLFSLYILRPSVRGPLGCEGQGSGARSGLLSYEWPIGQGPALCAVGTPLQS